MFVIFTNQLPLSNGTTARYGIYIENIILYNMFITDASVEMFFWRGIFTNNVTMERLKMGQVMGKRVLSHMRTTKVQISLRIRAVWSAPLLFAA